MLKTALTSLVSSPIALGSVVTLSGGGARNLYLSTLKSEDTEWRNYRDFKVGLSLFRFFRI
ncbi:hypothetical protein MHM_04190 [Candidatus Mycoplasma haemominutum 'Birmingham 1']|uniref:Uncharacterized protein n=1 Tax=Candidatus Mycoplasma haematominutum 'Birmingham 1' TaxID=1116213 RepID=G8C3N9_9MOLU|nr:hypothetical protein MHM_04190 [Candidatus Mycoplasma haematominutum 'Birmingham 1']